MRKYSLVVCGGTFDHFHKGHREFLRYGLSIGNRLLLGLTTDKFVANKGNNGGIENYNTRKKQIEDFLRREKARERVSIEPIDDVYIPNMWQSLPIEVIIISKDTISGAKQINLKRREQKKYPLKTEIVPLVKNTNNEYISSSRIRNGEINREGKPYINSLWFKRKLFITEKLRRDFKKPFGTLLRSSSLNADILERNVILGRSTLRPTPESLRTLHDKGDSGQARMTLNICLITVGDVTTKTFNKLKVGQNISVVDFKVARKKEFSSLVELGFSGREKIIKVVNPPGYLTAGLFKAVSKLFKRDNKKQKIVFVEGEEDLSVLPLILAAPLGAIIFYGQPNEGIVKVKISEENKDKAYELISRFKVSDRITRGH